MSDYVHQLYARAAAHAVGRLPGHGELPPRVQMPQVKVRVLSPAFFVRKRVPTAGEIITLDADDARGLVAQKLVEFVV